MSKWPPLSWAPSNWCETRPHDTRTGGGKQARGLSSAGRVSLNAHHGAVNSPGAKMMGVLSKLEHLSDFMAGLIARALGGRYGVDRVPVRQ